MIHLFGSNHAVVNRSSHRNLMIVDSFTIGFGILRELQYHTIVHNSYGLSFDNLAFVTGFDWLAHLFRSNLRT
jgi:hypothetical protein